LRQEMPPRWRERMRAAPFRFRVQDWLGYFGRLGWRVKEAVPTADEAARVGRRLPFVFPLSVVLWLTPKKERWRFRNASGVVMFERGDG